MKLAEFSSPGLIFTGLQVADRDSLLRAVAEHLAEARPIGDADQLYRELVEREELGSTSIGHSVAIPHCKHKLLSRVVLALFKTDQAINFGAEDGESVRLFFVLVSPERQPAAHLHCLAAIAKRVQDAELLDRLMCLDDPAELYRLLEN